MTATQLMVLEYLPSAVSEIRRRYLIDGVYLLGHSQGATVALLSGIYNSGTVDGLITVGLPHFDADWFVDNTLAAGRQVRVLLIHGAQDVRVPPVVSERAHHQLVAAGYSVTYRSIAGGHDFPTNQLGLMAQWIRGSKR
jgi:predicted esterase